MNLVISSKEGENQISKITPFSCSLKHPWPNNDHLVALKGKKIFFSWNERLLHLLQ